MRLRTVWSAGLVSLLAAAVTVSAQNGGAHRGPTGGRQVNHDLQVYFVDVEGGQSTLFVAPDGENLLVDTGSAGITARDATRIAAMCKQAGVAKIDNLLITHYHSDHVGGLPQLVTMVPVGRFIDHGINRESESVQGGASTVAGWNAYQKVLADGHAEHLVVKPGDLLPLKSLRVEIVSGDGEVIAKPLAAGGEANAACSGSPLKDVENTENDRSVGMVITFGTLRILDLGDLTWAKERGLMCPVNKLGKVDVYIVSHHGLINSGSPALVDAIAPRVAIMDNGAHKGGAPTTFETIEGSSRLKDLWQLHTAEGSDAKHNVAESHIANLPGPDAGNYLKLTARTDGSFSVTNGRTGETVEYPAK
ncbi:MAG TPA: MBL fold metallo-hydrolase [Acidobacteriaceae bacterium]|jgi:beta-lactamase superfamily II metal-dependent hydrolase